MTGRPEQSSPAVTVKADVYPDLLGPERRPASIAAGRLRPSVHLNLRPDSPAEGGCPDVGEGHSEMRQVQGSRRTGSRGVSAEDTVATGGPEASACPGDRQQRMFRGEATPPE